MIARFTVNGAAREVEIAPETRLIEMLHSLGLTGTPDAPGHDIVLLDERPVAAGLVLAALHDGARIDTAGGAPETVLQAFRDHDAAGHPETAALVMIATHALRVNPWMTEEEARAALLGHACAGTGHAPVVAAMLAAAARARGEVPADDPAPAEMRESDPATAAARAFGWDGRPPGGTALDEDGRLRLGCGRAGLGGVAVIVEAVVDRDTGHAALSRLTFAPTPAGGRAPAVAALTRGAARALFAPPDAPHAFTLPDILWAGAPGDPDPAAAESAMTAAVAGSIRDAAGIAETALPLTSDRILAAILARDATEKESPDDR